jgi:hypothetical protein
MELKASPSKYGEGYLARYTEMRVPGIRRNLTTLQRNIRDLANLADVTPIPRPLPVDATRAGGLVNFADLSRTVALPRSQFSRQYSY